ncbi:hypothetical protein KKF73_07290, partial [Patescibacteria group bacterium]|nr:hypothetical protein [Patescibacteria group bacterium]
SHSYNPSWLHVVRGVSDARSQLPLLQPQLAPCCTWSQRCPITTPTPTTPAGSMLYVESAMSDHNSHSLQGKTTST